MIMARSMTFSNSRTLPGCGHLNPINMSGKQARLAAKKKKKKSGKRKEKDEDDNNNDNDDQTDETA